jgi:hypothetical protein
MTYICTYIHANNVPCRACQGNEKINTFFFYLFALRLRRLKLHVMKIILENKKQICLQCTHNFVLCGQNGGLKFL